MLQGEVVNLRAIERSDATSIHRWLDDPELMRWWGYGVRAVSLASIQEHIEQWIGDERAFGHPVAFVIEALSGDPIGMMILSDVHATDRGAELSCFLQAGSRNQGFGKDALETVVEAAFVHWNYHRLTARCEAANERAHAFFTAGGFQLEGRLRDARFVDGAWDDILVFGRIRQEETSP